MGRVVYNGNISITSSNVSTNIDVSKLKRGVYFLTVDTETWIEKKRFVIE